MILSDYTIEEMLKAGTLQISPLDKEQIQPASVDIRLGDTFSIVEDQPSGIITMEKEIPYKNHPGQTGTYCCPNQFVLATTMEYFALPDDLTAFVEGRSSLGRMGLFIQNAGWVDPGFQGEITLELYNANRCAIELQSGRRVGQLVFARMDRVARSPLQGKISGAEGCNRFPGVFWIRKTGTIYKTEKGRFPFHNGETALRFSEKENPLKRTSEDLVEHSGIEPLTSTLPV